MADETRNFTVVLDDGEEEGTFSGSEPRQAALKVARRAAEVYENEDLAQENAVEIAIREKGTPKVHVYDAWAWERPVTDDDLEAFQEYDTLTEANVSKEDYYRQD